MDLTSPFQLRHSSSTCCAGFFARELFVIALSILEKLSRKQFPQINLIHLTQAREKKDYLGGRHLH